MPNLCITELQSESFHEISFFFAAVHKVFYVLMCIYDYTTSGTVSTNNSK